MDVANIGSRLLDAVPWMLGFLVGWYVRKRQVPETEIVRWLPDHVSAKLDQLERDLQRERSRNVVLTNTVGTLRRHYDPAEYERLMPLHLSAAMHFYAQGGADDGRMAKSALGLVSLEELEKGTTDAG